MPPKAPKVKVAGQLLKAFQSFDQNSDGTISKEELGALMQALDKSWTEKKVEKLLKVIDTDKNGKIDYDEFTRWVMAAPATEKDRKALLAAAAKAPAKAEGDKQAESSGGGKKEPAAAAADPAAQKELDELLNRIFKFYDEDEDEQIERIELLDGEEKRRGKLEFGPKVRKEVITWFKEAGAEGTPTDGMFLSKDKWRAALLKMVAAESEADASSEPEKLGAWLKEHYAPCLEQPAAPASAAEPSSSGGPAPAAPAAPPSYPLTIAFKDLKQKVEEAASFGKTVLVLSSGLDQVETYMNYQMTSLVDAKQLISEMFVQKSKSKEDARADFRQKVSLAMNSSGFCKPLHVRMANSAFDLAGLCGSEVPSALFEKKMTVEEALKHGFFDDGHKLTLTCDDRWKQFYIVITSTFDEAKAKEFLADKIPFFSEMAMIIVDPASVAK